MAVYTCKQLGRRRVGLPDLPYFTGDFVLQTLSPVSRREAAGRNKSPVVWLSRRLDDTVSLWHVKTSCKITIGPNYKDLEYSVSSHKIQWGWASAIWQLDSFFDTVRIACGAGSIKQSVCPPVSLSHRVSLKDDGPDDGPERKWPVGV